MTNWTERPIQLARTRQGEVTLLAGGEYWYAFRFSNRTVGPLQRHLTADEFHRNGGPSATRLGAGV